MIAEKDFAGRQTRGARGHQEDAYAFSDVVATVEVERRVDGIMAVVADGMGGHTSGEQASELALESFIDAFHRGSEPTLRERFKAAVLAANDAIANELKVSPELDGMGTTFLATAMTSKGLEWVSVGDSPLYLWREKTLKRLNEDHSFRPVLHEMIKSGELTAEAMAKHPFRNLLRAALTGAEIEMMDQSGEPLALKAGDVIIAATDGIQTLKDEAIAAVISKSPQENASGIAAKLLQAVLEAKHPKQDNTTVAVIKVGPEGFVPYPLPATPEPESKPDATTETIVMHPLQKRK